MKISDAIVLSYSVSEDFFHSESLIEFTKESQRDLLKGQPTRYGFVGIFADTNQASEYMTAFRAKLIKAKVGRKNKIYEDQPKGEDRITD